MKIIKNNGKVIDFTTLSDVPSGGGTGGNLTEDHRIIELEGMFKEAYSTMFVEYIKDGEDIVQINVWTSNLRTNKLFTKTISRINGLVTNVVLKDEKTLYQLSTTYTWLNGGLVSKQITRS